MKEGTTPAPWKFDTGSRTIRSIPGNHWLATMDSWDGAIDHAANTRLIVAAPVMLRELEKIMHLKSYQHRLAKIDFDAIQELITEIKKG